MSSLGPICPECGEPLSATGTACNHGGAARQAGTPCEPASLLTRANLLRMRGKWASAAELCAEALRHDPDNATAHSLFGDLLQDQGRLEEARHCYRRALELAPDRTADRARLARAEEVLEARRRRAEWEEVVAGRTPPVAARLMVRESLQRVVALAGAVVCAVVLVLAVLATVGSRAEPEEAGTDGASPRMPVPNQMIATETRRERDLLARVRTMGAGGAGQAVRVELDPMTQSGVVRVLLPTRARERAERDDTLRDLSLREGYRAARALHQADESLSIIHVYVVAQLRKPTVGPNSGPGLEMDTFLLLRGSLPRENLVLEPDKPDVAELQQLYSAVAPPAWGTPVPGS